MPIYIGIGGPDVLHVHGVVVAGLDVDVLQGRQNLGGDISGSGLDQWAGLTGCRVAHLVEGHNSELVEFTFDQTICPAFGSIR